MGRLKMELGSKHFLGFSQVSKFCKLHLSCYMYIDHKTLESKQHKVKVAMSQLN